MLVDIEPEYSSFIRDSWRSFSASTNDILKFRQKQNYTYNIISLRLINFLQLKLKKLETKKISESLSDSNSEPSTKNRSSAAAPVLRSLGEVGLRR